MTRAEYLLGLIGEERKKMSAYDRELAQARAKNRRSVDKRMTKREKDWELGMTPKRKGHLGQDLDWDQKRHRY